MKMTRSDITAHQRWISSANHAFHIHNKSSYGLNYHNSQTKLHHSITINASE